MTATVIFGEACHPGVLIDRINNPIFLGFSIVDHLALAATLMDIRASGDY